MSGGQEHGALVQQILETQKELQDGNKRPQSPKKGVEIVIYFPKIKNLIHKLLTDFRKGKSV